MANDGSGAGWSESSPANSDFVRDGAQEIRDVRRGVRIRFEKEHVTPAPGSVGGEHKTGSARAYYQSSTPTHRPDGSSVLDSNDAGRIYFNSSTHQLYVRSSGSWLPVRAGENTVDKKAIEPSQQFRPGMLMMFGGSTAPTGWLLCEGQAVSRTTYADLFNVIGTTYGSGNGSTTFNVPDLRGRVPVGAGTGQNLTTRQLGSTGGSETHTLTLAQMPTHTHISPLNRYDSGTGALGATDENGKVSIENGRAVGIGGDNAPRVRVRTFPEGSGSPHNNMQPFIAVNFIIKT